MGQDATPARSRPAIDNLMLIAVVVCVAIAVVRFALVAAAVPYAVYTNQRSAAAAVAAGKPVRTKRIAERVAKSGPWISWWGGRTIPYREGGDYLGVMSHHRTIRNLGCVVGFISEQDRKRGVPMTKVIVPEDRVALYGEESGNLMKRADGTWFRTEWAPLGRDAELLSAVPVVEQDYNPLLTPEQATQLRASAGLVKRSREFYVGEPKPGGSGVWVLHRSAVPSREFFLIPIESSPAAGVQ